jgi:Fe-S-cluster containining protein
MTTNKARLVKLNISTNLNTYLEQHKATAAQRDEVCRGIHHYIKQFQLYVKAGAPPEQVLQALYQNFEELERAIPATISQQLQCRKGCAHCCHIGVDITELEAKVIYQYCQENNITIPFEQLQTRKRTEACFFLGADNSCTIYKVRPSACRKYFSFSAPDLCDPVKYPEGGVINYLNMDMELIASAIYSIQDSYALMGEQLNNVHKRATSTPATV